MIIGETMNRVGKFFGKHAEATHSAGENRPVKLVPEGRNVWRMVYAD